MAAFTETKGQSLRSINDLLAMRNQRKRANADRMTQAGQFASGLMKQSSEAEKTREFQGEQGELDRETQRELTKAQLENNRILQELRGEQAVEQIGVGGEEERATLADQYRLRLDELNDQQAHEVKMIEEELEARKDFADWEQAKFENGFYQTQDGATFTWSDPRTYKAAMEELSEYNRKLTVLAGYEQDPNNPNSPYNVYIRATDRAKELMWEPEYNEVGQVEWKRSEVTIDEMLDTFVSELDVTGMTSPEKAEAEEAFRTYLNIIDKSPPQDFSDPGDGTTVNVDNYEPPLVRPDATPGETPEDTPAYTSPYTEESEELLGENPGLTRFLMGLGGLSAGEAISYLEEGYYPEGVTPGTRAGVTGRGEGSGKSTEQKLYDSLVELYRSTEDPEQHQAIEQHMQTLVDEEKESYPDIQSFLQQAIGGKTQSLLAPGMGIINERLGGSR